MKKINLILVSVLSMALFSCGGGLPDLNEKDGVAQVKDIAEDQFGGDREIYSLMLATKDHLTSDLMMIHVGYTKDDKNYSQSYLVEQEILDDEKSNSFKNNGGHQIKISDIDFDQITTKYNEAVKLLDEQGEMEDYTLHNWTYRMNRNGKLESTFTVEATKKGESAGLQGRNIVTNYYEFNFEVDENGELVVKS